MRSNIAREETRTRSSELSFKTYSVEKAEEVETPRQIPTPFGLNRWIHLTYGIIVVCIWGPLILNWNELSLLFLKEGSYKWVCDGSSSNRVLHNGQCKYQEAILGQLGILSMGIYYVGAFIGGCLMDEIGPRLVSMIGGIFITLSYVLLAISSEKIRTLYPYAIIQGFGTEFIFFGVVTIPNLFPGRRALILSLLAMAKSLAMLVCVILRHSRTDKFNVNVMGYLLLACSIIILIGNFLLVPKQPYKAVDQRGIPLAEDKVSTKQDYKLFGYTLCEPYYLIWLVCDSLYLARAQFHVVSVPLQHPAVTTALGILLGVGFVLCPPIGYLMDRYGSVPIIFAMNIFGTVGFICLISGKSLAAQWIGVFCIGIVESFSGSQNYALIQGKLSDRHCAKNTADGFGFAERYIERMVGKLTGLVTCFGGIFSLTNTPLWKWSVLHHKLRQADIVFLVYSGIITVFILVLWWNPPYLSANLYFKNAPKALLPTNSTDRTMSTVLEEDLDLGEKISAQV